MSNETQTRVIASLFNANKGQSSQQINNAIATVKTQAIGYVSDLSDLATSIVKHANTYDSLSNGCKLLNEFEGISRDKDVQALKDFFKMTAKNGIKRNSKGGYEQDAQRDGAELVQALERAAVILENQEVTLKFKKKVEKETVIKSKPFTFNGDIFAFLKAFKAHDSAVEFEEKAAANVGNVKRYNDVVKGATDTNKAAKEQMKNDCATGISADIERRFNDAQAAYLAAIKDICLASRNEVQAAQAAETQEVITNS